MHTAGADAFIRVFLAALIAANEFAGGELFMSENPYESSIEVQLEHARRFRFGKLIWLGGLVFLISILGFWFLLREYGAVQAQLADPEAAITPGELAKQVSGLLMIMSVAVLTSVVGLVVLVVGWSRTKRRSS